MCDACKEMLTDVPAKDWRIDEVYDRGPGEYYRYRVIGENLNWPRGHRERPICWSVPNLDDPRYDLSNAKRFV